MRQLLMKKRAFMAIANQIKGIKATKTGTFPVTLPGCVDNDCTVGYKIYGNTVTGKNLIPTIPEHTFVGVTLSKVNDYYVLNGECTESSNYVPFNIIIPEGTYTISANNPVTLNLPYAIIQIYNADLNKALAANDTKVSSTQTKAMTGGKYQFRIRVQKGITYNNFIIKPQLELGETATEYEPYHKNYVGDLSGGKYNIPIVTRGKNVFDITKCTGYRSSDNSIWISPNAQRAVVQGNVKDMTKMQAGKTYIITANSTSSTGHFVYLNGSKKVWWWGQKYTPTQADIDSWIAFYKATDDSEEGVTTGAVITNVQIEESAAATGYEPYHAPVTTTISLPAPLSAGEYISYTAQAIIHADDTKTSVSLPKIPTYKGTTVLECNTENAPASAEITYYTNEEE